MRAKTGLSCALMRRTHSASGILFPCAAIAVVQNQGDWPYFIYRSDWPKDEKKMEKSYSIPNYNSF